MTETTSTLRQSTQHAVALGHLMGVSLEAPDQMTRMVARLIARVAPAGSLYLADGAQEPRECNVNDIGVRLTAGDHFVQMPHESTGDTALFGDVVLKRLHNSSPSVDDAGAHSVGDGPGAGDASATPATEVTEDSLHTRLTFIQIDEGKAEEIYLAAQANLADAAENLAHARNETRDAETAYNDFINGGAK